jgi:hypothetical protein
LRAALAAALVALALPLSCGHDDGPSRSLSFDYIGPHESSSFLISSSADSPHPQIPSLLAVSAGPASAADSLSPNEARRSGFLISDDFPELEGVPKVPEYVSKPGRIELDRARRLLPEISPRGASLFAVPTSNGWVCYGLVPGFPSHCERHLDHGLALAIDDHDGAGGVPISLFGLAADSVRRMRVDVGGSILPAKLERNGFALTLPDAKTEAREIRAIIVMRQEGRRERLPLDWSLFK